MSDSFLSSGALDSSRRNTNRSSFLPPGSSSMTSSHPFLNMLNPLGRNYRGYERARDDVVEEEEEAEADNEEPEDRGEGTSRGARGWLQANAAPATGDMDRIRMGNLRPQTPENVVRDPDSYDDDDGEVPHSFMVEARRGPNSTKSPQSRTAAGDSKPGLPTSPTKLLSRAPFKRAARATFSDVKGMSMPPRPSELQSPGNFTLPVPNTTSASSAGGRKTGLDEHERALWNWVNVYNLDAFLQEVYAYYVGKGIYCIALYRGLNLLTVGFVIGFSTFLLGCVDYPLVSTSGLLSDVIVPHCVSGFSGFTLLFFLTFGAFWLWNIFTFAMGIMQLLDMYRFYTYLLDIPDADIQTISWQEIVRRIGKIREQNPVTALSSAAALQSDSITAPLDAHDIANRIMRQENYLIALFNKGLLNLRLPRPPLLQRLLPLENEGQGRTLTKALEWNLRFCLLGFLFDHNGRVRNAFTTQKNRLMLVQALRRRFIFMGCINAIFAPFIVLYLIMYSFFRYFEEYHKNPSFISSRQYTPFAQWKFREFNELSHLFKRRLHESYPAASEYIDQFPNEKMAQLMRFVAFIAGSFAAVLALASVIDPELFLHFEITPHRTVLFYIGVFGSILAVARGMIPEDHRVFDTEYLLREVIQFTHYMPNEWKGQLHSKKVHNEFGQLFQMKVMVFIQELVSVILTPFILWFSLPDCAPAIVDFFREFSVHVDGLGYVCSFAVFDFKRHGNVNFGAPGEVQDERYLSKEGKMEKSFLNFKAAHPDWNPKDPAGSIYLDRLAQLHPLYHPMYGHGPAGFNRRRNRFSGTTSDYRQNPILGSMTVGAGRSGNPLLHSTVGLAKEQRNAELARTYEAALQRSMAMKGKGHVGEASGAHDSGEGADEVQSELGDSYVDGRAARAPRSGLDEEPNADELEAEELANGGVMGLLTQIYDRRGRGL
ncbi:autophagy protein Apg9-domain-containing protein [Cantharellus anzutake]|uniref:autophagy protein Apg9-domain-containing protein n=1 Tax=Cantharellus anzutake TaxID=1750568 RepID=UPI0019032CD1|nr:autophagy protein Apg9-domain-containing protein [Cantharellus anzutake]KAF8328694.1 autophagy protein Apg9-domain-containing protein [Cantharellus anzutake]